MQEFTKENMHYHDTIKIKAFNYFCFKSKNQNLEDRIIEAYKQAGCSLFNENPQININQFIDALCDKRKIYYSSRFPEKGDIVLDIDKQYLTKSIHFKVIGLVEKITHKELMIVCLKKGKVDHKIINNWHACLNIDI